MSDTRVSLAVICGPAHREAVARMLRSVYYCRTRLADEVIVGWNGGGSPPTLPMPPQGVGVRVIPQVWRDDAAAARNEVYAAACGRWVWWLDCDDTVVMKDRSASHIADCLDTLPHGAVVRLPYRYSDRYPAQWQPRFLRRAGGWAWDRPIHEVLRPPPGELEKATVVDWHHPRIIHRPVEEHEVREDRRIHALRKLCDNGDRSALTLYYLGRYHEEADDALCHEYYRQAVKVAVDSQDDYERSLAANLAAAAAVAALRAGAKTLQRSTLDDAVAYGETLSGLCPHHPHGRYVVALARALAARWNDAIRAYERAEAMEEPKGAWNPLTFVDFSEIYRGGTALSAGMATAYARAGRRAQARRCLRQIPPGARRGLGRSLGL